MQSKVNIFHSLQHASDSEEENDAQTNKAKKIAEKKEQRAQRDEKKQVATKQAPATGVPAKENHAKTKAPYKAKGVSGDAHPLDRHSGHTNQAYGDKPKKQGAGKGNWGSYKEDRKGADEDKEVTAGEAGEEVPQEKVEEAPVGITLAEYYSSRQQAQNQPQVNEAKAKITSEQLTKELGTATVLKTKQQQQIDDKKAGTKKGHLDVNHKAAINSENAGLLNFRTGFVEKEYRQRGEGEAPNAGPRTRGPRTGAPREDAKQEETQQATEGQTAQPTEGTTQEGTATEGQATTTTTQAQGTQGQGQDNRRRNEGQRGGRGGHRGGERHQGDRPQGDRPPRKQQQGQGQQLNFDDSAFPKLG